MLARRVDVKILSRWCPNWVPLSLTKLYCRWGLWSYCVAVSKKN